MTINVAGDRTRPGEIRPRLANPDFRAIILPGNGKQGGSMARIVGIDHLTNAEINAAVEQGARFVVYHYTISIIVMTFRRSSAAHFVPAGSSAVVKGLPYTLLTLVAGWWGIPWGPIYTIGSLAKNLSGGENVTPYGAVQYHPEDVSSDQTVPQQA